MAVKKVFWIIWCVFLLYTLFFAPKTDQRSKSTGVYVKQLMFGPWNDIDPYIISLFYFLGIWPLVYMSILLTDGQNQPFNGSLASCMAMVLGGFILLPYFALRRSECGKKFRINYFVRLFESKLIAIGLMISTIGLILFAIMFGNLHEFRQEFDRNQFIHVMTIDFFVVSFLFPFLINDDLKRRDMDRDKQFKHYFPLTFIPLLGPLIYLYQRQPLQQTNNSKIQN
ncbi:hypothetical protein I4U23_000734 [Adineta vaga]|nr:hypothetical protein I4U23_000734 [Adineta vaga]